MAIEDKKKKIQQAEEIKEAEVVKEEVATAEEEIDENEDLKLKLSFPTACIVREMKKYIDKDKMVRKEVKIAMNKFLAEIVKDVATTMNKNPYSVMDYRMFEEAAKPFRQTKEIQNEKRRLVAHLNKVIEDCDSLKRDLDLKFSEVQIEV